MKRHIFSAALLAVVCGSFGIVRAQQGGGLSAADRQRRIDTEKELESIAVIDCLRRSTSSTANASLV